jgi:hypothetical protein
MSLQTAGHNTTTPHYNHPQPSSLKRQSKTSQNTKKTGTTVQNKYLISQEAIEKHC